MALQQILTLIVHQTIQIQIQTTIMLVMLTKSQTGQTHYLLIQMVMESMMIQISVQTHQLEKQQMQMDAQNLRQIQMVMEFTMMQTLMMIMMGFQTLLSQPTLLIEMVMVFQTIETLTQTAMAFQIQLKQALPMPMKMVRLMEQELILTAG